MLTNIPTNGRSFFRALGSVCALCVMLGTPAIAQETPENPNSEVKVSDYGTVDLAVQDTDLAQVLEMLSIQSRKNIITSKNVSATVTANLFDVTFYEALDAILHVNGYGYIEKGNFIYVYTQEELEKIKAANRQTESRIFELDYLSATDAQEFIQPLLSEDGKASVRGEVQTGFKPTVDDGGADEYAYNVKVVVNDYPENLDEVARLLGELDVPPEQVMIEATVLQATLNEENSFGIDFSVIGSVDFSDFANPLSGVDDLLFGNEDGSEVEATNDDGFQPGDNSALAITSPVGGTSRPDGFKVGVMDDDISVFLRALDRVTDTTLLARPKVMALNRQRAEVRVGREEGFAGTENVRDNGTTSQEIEFLESGIILAFRPFISENGMIRMELAPEVSTSFFTEDSQGNRIPNKSTNELTTNVRVRDGETIVLGGLFQEDTSITRRQVPVLGDVPLLGAAFRGQDDNVTRREIIFLITPTIVRDEKLWAAGEKAEEYANLLQVGAREGLLPFSRAKTTENYNNDALREFSEGNLDKALYYANNSLRLNPIQPEMRRLRQRITGEKEHSYERNMLERIMRQEFSGMMDPADKSFNDGDQDGAPDEPNDDAVTSSEEYTDTSKQAKVKSSDQDSMPDDENADENQAQAAGEETVGQQTPGAQPTQSAAANEPASVEDNAVAESPTADEAVTSDETSSPEDDGTVADMTSTDEADADPDASSVEESDAVADASSADEAGADAEAASDEAGESVADASSVDESDAELEASSDEQGEAVADASSADEANADTESSSDEETEAVAEAPADEMIASAEDGNAVSDQSTAQANEPAEVADQDASAKSSESVAKQDTESDAMAKGEMQADANESQNEKVTPNAQASADADGSKTDMAVRQRRTQIMIDAWLVDFFKSLGLPDLAEAIENNDNLDATANADAGDTETAEDAATESDSSEQIANVDESKEGQN